MTFREQCALAAMREILRDDLRRSPHLAEGQTMADYTTTVASVAWQHADAMEAELAKRETPAQPAPIGDAPHEWRGGVQIDLVAENAKLRAVAEAAAELVDGMGGFDAMDLRANVKRALAGWRTK